MVNELAELDQIAHSFGTTLPQTGDSLDAQGRNSSDSPVIPLIQEDNKNVDQNKWTTTTSSDISRDSSVPPGSRKWKRLRMEDASLDSTKFKIPHISHVATHAYSGEPIAHCVSPSQQTQQKDESINSCPCNKAQENSSDYQEELINNMTQKLVEKAG
ncbi:hypothetical protein MKX03_009825, partial [Papaver bracteatum]